MTFEVVNRPSLEEIEQFDESVLRRTRQIVAALVERNLSHRPLMTIVQLLQLLGPDVVDLNLSVRRGCAHTDSGGMEFYVVGKSLVSYK